MTLDARKLGFNVLLALAVYLPLEDYVLRWVPAPLPVLIALRQLPEVIVWCVALAAAGLHLAQRGTIRVIGQRVDLYLVAFLAVAAVGIVLNEAHVVGSFVGLKALLRYVPLVYALVMLAPEPEDLDRVWRAILISAALQVGIGLAEWVGGWPMRRVFSVVNSYDEAGRVASTPEAVRGWDRYDVTGTMVRPIAYAYFLLVGLALWLVRTVRRPGFYAAGIAVVVLMTFGTGSRMAVLMVLFLVGLHQITVRGLRWTAFAALALVPLGLALVIAAGGALTERLYVFDVFTPEYQEHALTNRLGILTYILPYALDGGVTPFGYSPDLSVVVPTIAAKYDVPDILLGVLVQILEDVYWVALLLYFGFVGLTFLVLFLGTLTRQQYRLSRWNPDPRTRAFALVAFLLLVLSIPLNAVNQAYEVRQFAYYLWLFVGLALASALRPPRAVQGVPMNAVPVEAAPGGP